MYVLCKCRIGSYVARVKSVFVEMQPLVLRCVPSLFDILSLVTYSCINFTSSLWSVTHVSGFM